MAEQHPFLDAADPADATLRVWAPYRCAAAALRGWLAVRPALQRCNGHALFETALESRTLPPSPAAPVDPGSRCSSPWTGTGTRPFPHRPARDTARPTADGGGLHRGDRHPPPGRALAQIPHAPKPFE
ncbi:hypothetical protein [Nocardia sp. NPDC051981]|uniref:hypothetical protein n=1 Tax=Nocardia sp. NPDC051981 TaxID=3155417 RepID=UPI00341B0210